MEQSDEEIIGLVLDGQKQAYSLLIQRYQRQIFNLMYRYCRLDHEAADLTQEVFVRAYERLNTFKSEYSFFSWLYTMAVNRANDWARKKTRQRLNHEKMSNHAYDHQNFNSMQENMLENKEELLRLQRAVDMLPDETREILMLRFHEECPVKEVARIFSISESAVKMRTSRGLRLLQSLMQKGL